MIGAKHPWINKEGIYRATRVFPTMQIAGYLRW